MSKEGLKIYLDSLDPETRWAAKGALRHIVYRTSPEAWSRLRSGGGSLSPCHRDRPSFASRTPSKIFSAPPWQDDAKTL